MSVIEKKFKSPGHQSQVKDRKFVCDGCGKVFFRSYQPKSDVNLRRNNSTKDPFIKIGAFSEGAFGTEHYFIYNSVINSELHFCKGTFFECLKVFMFNKKMITGIEQKKEE